MDGLACLPDRTLAGRRRTVACEFQGISDPAKASQLQSGWGDGKADDRAPKQVGWLSADYEHETHNPHARLVAELFIFSARGELCLTKPMCMRTTDHTSKFPEAVPVK